jgi:hypothetical protein
MMVIIDTVQSRTKGLDMALVCKVVYENLQVKIFQYQLQLSAVKSYHVVSHAGMK